MSNKIMLKNANCITELKKIPEKSVDMIFADPPYNLSGKGHLTCKNGRTVSCNKGAWDVVDDIHAFNYEWISECIRVLKDEGTLWVSGTLHNHPSIGVILKNLGMWLINDVVWFKPNAPPLLSSNRCAPSTELIWVASKTKKYYFDYKKGKEYNNGKQLRNLWVINAKRHITKHPTEKPEELLERILSLGCPAKGLVLDPFMGSGTTGVIAKRQNKGFIGFEIDKDYFEIAKKRINLEK